MTPFTERSRAAACAGATAGAAAGRIAIAACSVLVLAGCASPGDQAFRFEANASSIDYPPEDADEAMRRERLRQYLDDNGLCPEGYEITRRRPVVIDAIRLGTPYRILYEGRCTRPA